MAYALMPDVRASGIDVVRSIPREQAKESADQRTMSSSSPPSGAAALLLSCCLLPWKLSFICFMAFVAYGFWVLSYLFDTILAFFAVSFFMPITRNNAVLRQNILFKLFSLFTSKTSPVDRRDAFMMTTKSLRDPSSRRFKLSNENDRERIQALVNITLKSPSANWRTMMLHSRQRFVLLLCWVSMFVGLALLLFGLSQLVLSPEYFNFREYRAGPDHDYYLYDPVTTNDFDYSPSRKNLEVLPFKVFGCIGFGFVFFFPAVIFLLAPVKPLIFLRDGRALEECFGALFTSKIIINQKTVAV